MGTSLRELSRNCKVDVLTSKGNGRLISRARSVVIITPNALLTYLDDPKNQDFFQDLSLVVCENLEFMDKEYEIAAYVASTSSYTVDPG